MATTKLLQSLLGEKHQDYDLAATYAVMTSLPLKHGFAPQALVQLHRYNLGKDPRAANVRASDHYVVAGWYSQADLGQEAGPAR
jgi:hypothetical protein